LELVGKASEAGKEAVTEDKTWGTPGLASPYVRHLAAEHFGGETAGTLRRDLRKEGN